MAKKKRKSVKRRSAPKRHRKHRRKGRRTVTVSGFRRVTLSNPLGGRMLLTSITGLASGALTGFVTTKMLGERSMGIRAATSVALGLLGAWAFKRSPDVADAWGSTAIGSIGYVFGVNAGGGVVATNKADAVAAIAAMKDTTTKTTASSSSSGQSGMGVLVPINRSGMGVLTSVPGARALTGRGMSAPPPVRNPRALVGMG